MTKRYISLEDLTFKSSPFVPDGWLIFAPDPDGENKSLYFYEIKTGNFWELPPPSPFMQGELTIPIKK